MDVVEAVKTRKSIRLFKPDPVPKETIKEILDIAVRAPSAMNTQPWELTVVTGEVLNNIRKANVEKALSGAAPDESPHRGVYKDVYRQRQVDLAVQLFNLMGITREDKEKRKDWMQRGFRYFDAPAAIIISADKQLEGTWSLFDIGCLSQTISLVALNYGLGTCIEDQGSMYAQGIKKYAGIPDSKEVIISIAIGYPDWDFPANAIQTPRAPVDDITAWIGF
jgi:nitroreductase